MKGFFLSTTLLMAFVPHGALAQGGVRSSGADADQAVNGRQVPSIQTARGSQPSVEALASFQARMVIALSDADMVPSAYIDGRLGPARGRDALTVLRIDQAGVVAVGATLPVSNSVTGPPAAFAITPDGRYAIVVETLGQRPPDGRDVRLAGLAPARSITVVDLAASAGPTVVQQIRGPAAADSVSISADGSLVAVAVRPSGDGKDTPLVVYRLANGRLDRGVAPSIPGWTRGNRLMEASFHPSRPVLALVDETGGRVIMAQVDPSTRQLVAWGNAIPIERGPYLARFTPDGRYLLLTATYTDATPRSGENAFPRGSIFSIRVESERNAQGQPQHIVASRAMTGFVPEGLAIAPDGRHAVTVNLERTSYAPEDPRFRPFASLTLVSIEPQSGELRRIGDFPFDGVLPESAAFDRSGRMLAVANYGEPYDPVADGSIDFWRLVEDPQDPSRTKLIKTERSVTVQRGAHVVAVVP